MLEHGRSGRYQVVKHRYEHSKGDRSQQSKTCVVFPRRAAHVTCEKACPTCRVCVHRYTSNQSLQMHSRSEFMHLKVSITSTRYGCTCSSYMLHDRMCVHIHRIASLKGAPPAEFVRPDLTKEDTVGLPEALRRLQTLNHRERMKPLLPMADELFELIKVPCSLCWWPRQVKQFFGRK